MGIQLFALGIAILESFPFAKLSSCFDEGKGTYLYIFISKMDQESLNTGIGSSLPDIESFSIIQSRNVVIIYLRGVRVRMNKFNIIHSLNLC